MRIINLQRSFASNKHGRRGLLRSHEGKLRREKQNTARRNPQLRFHVVHMMCACAMNNLWMNKIEFKSQNKPFSATVIENDSNFRL